MAKGGLGGNPFKKAVRLREVVYTISPSHVKIMGGKFHEFPGILHHKISDAVLPVVLVVSGVFGPIWYAKHSLHQKDLAHRY